MTGPTSDKPAGDLLLSQVSQQELMRHVTTIAQWVRLSGTDDERHAFDYIDQTLTEYGLETFRFNPVCLVSLPGESQLVVRGTEQELPCITHSFATSTPAIGIESEVVYVGNGTESDYQQVNVAGKIVLAEGLATPGKVAPAERHGAIGMIHISGEHRHDMIISPVWGSPTPETIGSLPSIPHVSVDTKAGETLKSALSIGKLTVRLTATVNTGWRPLPILVASIKSTRVREHEEFILFSGHVDSWYYGAMDNGSANAAMMEIARILSSHRDSLRREVRLAFWSGHSHARYATSAWYADEFWHELHDSCVAHVNVDSPGAINATVLSEAATMAETYPLAKEIIADRTDQDLAYRRIGRMGDQSFWGVGVPSFFCSISEQGQSEEMANLTELLGGSKGRSGGLGWWWHTPYDTVDKIDLDNLVRDTRVLMATIHRLATDQIIPLDQSQAVEEILTTLRELQQRAEDSFDLSGVIADAEVLRTATRQLSDRCERETSEQDAGELNRCIMRISRLLIPVNYTESGQFDQDPALTREALPGLRTVDRLTERTINESTRQTVETRLRRERNRVRHALREATREIERTLAVVGR